MSESIQADDVEAIVHNWFVWKSAVSYLQKDAQVISSSDVRFPTGYSQLLMYMATYSQGVVEYYTRQLRKRDIRILAEQTDRNEHFVLWKHRGETKMLRLLEAKLRHEVQERINAVVDGMN